jgi:hypothetical protein
MMIGVEPTLGSSNEEMLAWDINNVLLNNGAPMLGVEPSPAASNFEMLLWDILQNSGGGGGPGTQVQSDWDQTNNTQVDFIKNKPTIPAAQIQSDWDQTNNVSKDFIKNKPTIPAAQVQSDWDQTNTSAADYIKNKPSVYSDTYSRWSIDRDNGELPEGHYINIEDAENCDLGLVLFCPAKNQISIQGVGLFLDADYIKEGDYSGVEAITGVTPDRKRGVWTSADEGAYNLGDTVIWLNQHYQLTDETEINGDSPAINNLAYTILPRTLTTGFIEAADLVEYDFDNNYIQKRKDTKGNEISISYPAYTGVFEAMEPKPIFQFTWGNPAAYSNYANESYISNYDSNGNFYQNTLIGYSFISLITGLEVNVFNNYVANRSKISIVNMYDYASLKNNHLDNEQWFSFNDLFGTDIANNTISINVEGITEIDLRDISCDMTLVLAATSGTATIDKIKIASKNLKIQPFGGLVVTLNGTTISSYTEGDLVMESASYVLNGNTKPNAVFTRRDGEKLYLESENIYL